MSLDIDYLDLDSIVAEAELESGIPLSIVSARYPSAQVSASIQMTSSIRSPQWSDTDIEFVRQQLGRVSFDEIGEQLGRSAAAIKIIQVRRGLPAPSRQPGWLTAHQVSVLLGVDVHAVCAWTDLGFFPFQFMPGDRRIRMIRYTTLLRWIVNPKNWIYFKYIVDNTQRIMDKKLRRLIERQKQRWGDDWWTPGQVAAYHGVDHKDVNRLIRQGKIQGVKWGNWWILRSEAMKPGLMFYKGGGNAQVQLSVWSDRANAFLVKSRANGMTWKTIAKKMKMKESRVSHHHYWLRNQGLLHNEQSI